MCQEMEGSCRGVVEMLTLMMMRWWCRLNKQLSRRWAMEQQRSQERRALHPRQGQLCLAKKLLRQCYLDAEVPRYLRIARS